ncbi:hypothetical protein N7497_006182 [Penicillium chrysogenum]|nr:hypothetical protein N7497_006182 [Penicillium chrysogenum]
MSINAQRRPNNSRPNPQHLGIRSLLGSSDPPPPEILPPPSPRPPRPWQIPINTVLNDLASHMTAQLIRAHAINGSAHIIGHSLGAQVAIRLASTDPDVVNSIFISGFGMFPRTSITPYIPYAAWAMSRMENCLARP